MITHFEVNVPGQNDPAKFTLYYARDEEGWLKGMLTTEEGGFEILVASLEAVAGYDEKNYTMNLMHVAHFEAIKYVRAGLDITVKEEP